MSMKNDNHTHHTMETTTTTTIYGRSEKFWAMIQQTGAKAHAFTGGYDDYYGAMYWAEVPGSVSGTPARFSPDPGRWMTGVRL